VSNSLTVPSDKDDAQLKPPGSQLLPAEGKQGAKTKDTNLYARTMPAHCLDAFQSIAPLPAIVHSKLLLLSWFFVWQLAFQHKVGHLSQAQPSYAVAVAPQAQPASAFAVSFQAQPAAAAIAACWHGVPLRPELRAEQNCCLWWWHCMAL
jgi:hypothetical protein